MRTQIKKSVFFYYLNYFSALSQFETFQELLIIGLLHRFYISFSPLNKISIKLFVYLFMPNDFFQKDFEA